MAHDVLWLSIRSDHSDEIAVHMEDGINPGASDATTLAVVLGLAHVWWLYGLRRQQGPWLTDVIEQVYGSSSQQLESFSGKAHLDIPEDGAEPR